MIRTGAQYRDSMRDGREIYKPPQEQDPDMLLHVVKETDAGI